MFVNIFGCYNLGRWVLLTRGAAKHPPEHRTVTPTTKNDPSPNVNRAEVETP